MEENKFTKGEWSVNDQHIMSENRKSIAICHLMNFKHDTRGRRIKDTESMANAKLISCAPEMLEILVKITKESDEIIKINSVGATETYYQLINQAEQLIKKATS